MYLHKQLAANEESCLEKVRVFHTPTTSWSRHIPVLLKHGLALTLLTSISILYLLHTPRLTAILMCWRRGRHVGLHRHPGQANFLLHGYPSLVMSLHITSCLDFRTSDFNLTFSTSLLSLSGTQPHSFPPILMLTHPLCSFSRTQTSTFISVPSLINHNG